MTVRARALPVLGATFVAALVGCCSRASNSSSAPVDVPVAAPVPAPVRGPATLATALDAELGTPVAIVPAPEGIVAVSADGSRSHVLVAAEVPWLLVDNRAQVVWFRVADTVRVLDLASPDPTPQVVASGLPFLVQPEGVAGFMVFYAPGELLRKGHPAYHTIILDLEQDEPTLVGDGGVWEGDDHYGAAIAAVHLADDMRAFLRELVLRGAGRSLVLPNPPPITTRLEVDPSACEEEELCGKAEAIPGTGLWQVIVGHSCGDGCYMDYAVYDPATQEYLDVPWSPMLSSFWISGDGKAAIHAGTIVSLPDGRTLFGEGPEAGYDGGGWLGDEWYLGW